MILKNERNRFYYAIQTQHLDPREFVLEFEDVTTGAQAPSYETFGDFLGVVRVFPAIEPRFRFGATKYERGWRYAGVEFDEYVNAQALRRDPRPRDAVGRFDEMMTWFDGWLQQAVRPFLGEQSAPDLWRQLEASRAATDLALPGDLNERFSPIEKDQLRIAVQTFKILIINEFAPAPDVLRAIEARLDHVVDVLDNDPPKIDWRGIVISALFGIATDLALDPEKSRRLFALFQEAVEKGLHLLM